MGTSRGQISMQQGLISIGCVLIPPSPLLGMLRCQKYSGCKYKCKYKSKCNQMLWMVECQKHFFLLPIPTLASVLRVWSSPSQNNSETFWQWHYTIHNTHDPSFDCFCLNFWSALISICFVLSQFLIRIDIHLFLFGFVHKFRSRSKAKFPVQPLMIDDLVG